MNKVARRILWFAENSTAKLARQKPTLNSVERFAHWIFRGDPTLQRFRDKWFQPAAEILIKLNIHPNAISVAGVFFAFLAAVCMPNQIVFSILLLLNMISDGLDGVVSRRMGVNNDVGSIVDVACDTVSLLIVAAGFLAHGAINTELFFLYAIVTILYTTRSATKSKIIAGVYRSIGSRIAAFSGAIFIATSAYYLKDNGHVAYFYMLSSITVILFSTYIVDYAKGALAAKSR